MTESNFIPGTEIKKPKVKLIGVNGNSFNLMGVVTKALRKAKAPQVVISAYQHEAMSSDYEHLLRTCMYYVDVR